MGKAWWVPEKLNTELPLYCNSSSEYICKRTEPGLRQIFAYTSMFIAALFPTAKSRKGFPRGSDGKESASSAGDLGSIPGLGRPPEEGHGNALQYSGLENSMDREEPSWLQSMRSQRLDVTEQLSTQNVEATHVSTNG